MGSWNLDTTFTLQQSSSSRKRTAFLITIDSTGPSSVNYQWNPPKVHKPEKEQYFKGRLADRTVQRGKLTKQRNDRPHVFYEGKRLDNVLKFLYLVTTFPADDDQWYDIERSLNLPKTQCAMR